MTSVRCWSLVEPKNTSRTITLENIKLDCWVHHFGCVNHQIGPWNTVDCPKVTSFIWAGLRPQVGPALDALCRWIATRLAACPVLHLANAHGPWRLKCESLKYWLVQNRIPRYEYHYPFCVYTYIYTHTLYVCVYVYVLYIYTYICIYIYM